MNALEIRELRYRYPGGREVLRGIDLAVEKGARVAVAGRNGSGKSTLLLHVPGLLDGEGHISVMGVIRSKKTVHEIRAMTGFLFSQAEYQFIMPDLLNDVMLGVPVGAGTTSERESMAMGWIERMGLSRYARTSPLDLSSGEMKRAALAGVLAREPKLLLLDEPLANLDRQGAAALVAILNEYPVTMLMATHSRFLVEELATHVAVMNEGKISGLYERRAALKRSDVRSLLF